MGLGGNSRQIFEFKGLIGKIFRNKDLARFSLRSGFRQRADGRSSPQLFMFSKKAEIGLGRLRGPSWETGTPLHCSSSGDIVAPVGLEVCDGAHSLDVMKKVGLMGVMGVVRGA